jgi:hypothetical protein
MPGVRLIDCWRLDGPRKDHLAEQRKEYVGEDMAVGTITIQIPIRALWWLKWVADREKVTPERLVEILVLRKLESMGEVHLWRSPAIDE